MTIGWQEQLRPGVALREIVQEATSALVSMDAERLEELARCCADLNRELQEAGEIPDAAVALQSAASEVNLLGYVLYETRANLAVLSRLRAIRLREAADLDPNLRTQSLRAQWVETTRRMEWVRRLPDLSASESYDLPTGGDYGDN